MPAIEHARHRRGQMTHVQREGGKMARVMREFHEGTLRSSSGQKVRKVAQAKAIGMSSARAAGERVAPKPKKKGGRKR